MDQEKKSHSSPLQPSQVTSPNALIGPGFIKPLDLKSDNMPLSWKNWITQLKIYLRANNLEHEQDNRKVAILLHFIGAETLQIFYSFNVCIDTVKFDALIEKFTHHFTPQVNITMERHKLFNRRQGIEESIDDYVTDLKNISKKCEFKELEDSILRDILSWNLTPQNQYIKEKILLKKPHTFEAAINIAKCAEITKIQAKTLEDTTFVGQIQTNKQRNRSRHRQHQPNITRQSSRSRQYSSSRRSNTTEQPKCSRCGQIHRFKCPAKGVKCNKCGKFNHFAAVCHSKQLSRMQLQV
ncbi:unnamed protein product, partial [Brenthis ino]